MKQAEEEEKEEDMESRISKCQEIYRNTIGDLVSFDGSFKLELDLTEYKHQNFMKELTENKIALPKIKRVQLKKLKDHDKSILSGFFSNCIAEELPLLAVNYNGYLHDISLILDSLVKCLPKVTKEVFIERYNLEASHIERIVQISSNSKILHFYMCKFITKERMNFRNGKLSLGCLETLMV